MNLEDFAAGKASRVEHPDKEWRPTIKGTANEAVVITQPLEGNPKHDEIMRSNGYPPEDWELVGDMTFNRRPLANGNVVTSYRFKVRRRQESLDLPSLYAEAAKSQPSNGQKPTSKKALVVCWADTQTGKYGSRGGTPELVARIMEKRDKLEKYIAEQGTSIALFLDAGDSIENFESTGQQSFTNDLSLMDQIDIESSLEQKMIELLAATHSEVWVAGVGSNHCGWRKGKSYLGKPADDWGLFIKRQLAKAFELNPEAYGHVRFFEPEEWSESLVLDVFGTGIGLMHGHQVKRPEAIPDHWAGQVHGAQVLTAADVLITGHFHHFRIMPTGRSIRTGRSKFWIQAPSLDNGSDWFKNLRGEDSDPGLVVFVVDEDGFNLQSLTIL